MFSDNRQSFFIIEVTHPPGNNLSVGDIVSEVSSGFFREGTKEHEGAVFIVPCHEPEGYLGAVLQCDFFGISFEHFFSLYAEDLSFTVYSSCTCTAKDQPASG
jgi:hypothetical protein